MRHSLGPIICIIVFLTFGNGSDKVASPNEGSKSSQRYPSGIKVSTLNHKATEFDVAKVRQLPPSISSAGEDLLGSSPSRDVGIKEPSIQDFPKIRRKRVGIEIPERSETMPEREEKSKEPKSNDGKSLAHEGSPKKKNRAADSGPKIISSEANNMLHTHVSPHDDEPGDSMKPDSSLYSREEEVKSRHLIEVKKLLNDSLFVSPVVINTSGGINTPTIPIKDETFSNDPATNPPVEFPVKGDIRTIANVSEAEKKKFNHVYVSNSKNQTDTSSNVDESEKASSTPKSEPSSTTTAKEATTTITTEKIVQTPAKETSDDPKLTSPTVVPPSTTVSSTPIASTSPITEKTNVPSSSEAVTESINDTTTTVSTIETTAPTIKTSTDVSSTTIKEEPANKTNVLASNSKQEKNDESMPSGIIALVTAIVFGVAVVVAYAGLIAWRKYLEHRYGNRELLVNDLDFDSNDLRHFEL